mmetsp:Transcript_46592/g.117321  ORF Transcript_46592/g.117321 Transcript_46592/m.117321 type:complete len:215 (-) Transcript_46592:702-1346(-)
MRAARAAGWRLCRPTVVHHNTALFAHYGDGGIDQLVRNMLPPACPDQHHVGLLAGLERAAFVFKAQGCCRVDGGCNEGLIESHVHQYAGQVHHKRHGHAVCVWVEVASQRNWHAVFNQLPGRRWCDAQDICSCGEKDGDCGHGRHGLHALLTHMLKVTDCQGLQLACKLSSMLVAQLIAVVVELQAAGLARLQNPPRVLQFKHTLLKENVDICG